ncbi:MAG: hypothetical protein M5U14_03285 [Acidimicrobiia bacterium]|nr:hypothetical protein [Acidimicrobiia bacterium]
MRAARRRAGGRGEAGFVALEWATGIGLLLFPVAVLVVALPAWSERQVAATVAAREAARAWVESGDDTAGFLAAGTAVDEVVANHGIDPGEVSVGYEGTVRTRDPGARVRVTVSVEMPVLAFPGLFAEGRFFTWSAVHQEPVDPYRSR